jgi:hypothetical protein
MKKNEETRSWPDLAVGLYDRLTGRSAEITYEFDKMQIGVPSGVGESADRARWTVDGTIKIRTRDVAEA